MGPALIMEPADNKTPVNVMVFIFQKNLRYA